jgi:ankyrin repeat protein
MKYADDPVSELLLAADCGDTAVVIELLASGLHPDVRAIGGASPLLMAVRNGHVEIVRVLLEHGAHPNPDGWRGYTALTHAIQRSLRGEGSKPLELLLAAGARYNLVDAVLANDLEFVRGLLDEGGNPNEGEGSYNGPLLMEAAQYGHVEMVRLLLARGARIEATDDINQTTLHEAARYSRIDVVRCLLDSGADINTGYPYETALTMAENEGHREMVAFLLARGARWSLKDALARGDVALFRTLLDEEILARREDDETGSDDSPDDPDPTAKVDRISGRFGRITMDAVGYGNLEIVRFLLDRGASHFLDWRDHHSLLAEASQHGHVEVARLLIDRGADLHAIGWDGLTPLSWAIKQGRIEIVELLKHAGAER